MTLSTGEILAEAGTVVDKKKAEEIQNAGSSVCMDCRARRGTYKVLSNMMVDLAAYV